VDRQRDRAGPAAQVDDGRRVGPVDAVDAQAPLDQQLGLRPGNEHARPDRHLDPVERGDPGEVLERYPIGPGRDQRAQPLGPHRVERRPHREPGTGNAEHMRRQNLGVDPRGRDTGRRQNGHGFPDRPSRIDQFLCGHVVMAR
jgi:hypothetical protein